jgi:heme exporter protein D
VKEFLAMGGYAFYVWMSFGLTFVVMAAIAIGSRAERRRAIESVKKTALVTRRRAAGKATENKGDKVVQ